MSSLRDFICLILAGTAFTPAFAIDDYNRTVASVGAQQTPARAYFRVAENWSQPCANNVMYIDVSTPAGKSLFANVLEAKATGNLISWVNYTLDAGNICNATLVELK